MLTVFASLAASRKPGRGGVAEGTTRGGVPEGRMLAGMGTVRGEAGAGAFSSPATMRGQDARGRSNWSNSSRWKEGVIEGPIQRAQAQAQLRPQPQP